MHKFIIEEHMKSLENTLAFYHELKEAMVIQTEYLDVSLFIKTQ